jgi:hypothetical protein
VVIWEEENLHVATTKVNGTLTASLGQTDSKLQLTVPYQSLGVPLYVLPTNMTPPLDGPPPRHRRLHSGGGSGLAPPPSSVRVLSLGAGAGEDGAEEESHRARALRGR